MLNSGRDGKSGSSRMTDWRIKVVEYDGRGNVRVRNDDDGR